MINPARSKTISIPTNLIPILLHQLPELLLGCHPPCQRVNASTRAGRTTFGDGKVMESQQCRRAALKMRSDAPCCHRLHLNQRLLPVDPQRLQRLSVDSLRKIELCSLMYEYHKPNNRQPQNSPDMGRINPPNL